MDYYFLVVLGGQTLGGSKIPNKIISAILTNNKQIILPASANPSKYLIAVSANAEVLNEVEPGKSDYALESEKR